MQKRTLLSKRLLLTFGGAAALGGPPAHGQQALERVEITGSNIRRVANESASPIQIITHEEIERSGKATVGEYLQTLTVDGQGSIPPGFGSGFAPGAIGVSLRGLGAGSTLVLLNGRRMAPYGFADDGQKVFTDLSTVPMEAVERIEVLKDGASAIYGSDAIAGVVNIILRKEIHGTTAKASYGTSRYGDGDQGRASVTTGFGDLAADRYNIWVNLEAFKTNEITYKDHNRAWIGDDDTRKFGYLQGGSFFTPAGAITGTGGTVGGNSPVGNVRVGTQFKSLPGCGVNTPTLTPPDPQGGCIYAANQQYRWLTPEIQSVNIMGRGTFKIAGDTEAFFELGYSKKETVFNNTPSGVSGSWGYPGGGQNASSGPGAVVLAPSHPDNVVGGDRLRYSAVDVGARVTNVDNRFVRVLAGLQGTIADWDYQTAVLHSETDLTSVRNGFLRYSVVRSALGDPASPFFPWRIGANSNLNSPALYAALSPPIQAEGKGKVDLIDLKVTRELMALPGGPMALAMGTEYRRDSASLTPYTYTDVGDIIGLGYSAFDGGQNLFAAYAEVLAPVFKGLELSGAVRYDRYSSGLSATTPKLGIKYEPIAQLALRGTYAEGFRAPNAAETAGNAAGFTTARDPVRCPGGTPAPNATPADCAQQIAIITTGNPNLQPEKSKSYTVGLVFEPVQGSSVAVDFWQIKRTDEINQPLAADAVAAGNFIRSDNNLPGVPNSGTLLAALGPYINSSSSKVKGVDLDYKQRFGLGNYGALLGSVVWTHINSWQRTDAGQTFEFAGTHDNCDVSNCVGTFKDRVNIGLTWKRDTWEIGTTIYYFSSIKNFAFQDYENCANHFADGTDAPSGCKIPSFTTVDLSGRWNVTKNVELFGSIQNLFDRVAPLDPQTYGAVNFNPMHVSGAVGRYYTVGLKYRF